MVTKAPHIRDRGWQVFYADQFIVDFNHSIRVFQYLPGKAFRNIRDQLQINTVMVIDLAGTDFFQRDCLT
jgi:hypothetical protein